MLNRLSLNRIGLNRIGLNRIGKSSGGSSDRPYIDPKVLDSLCGVWIMDQNTNESESRNIIKNKIADRGGDLELLNFAYKANSGYNGYPEDFTSWNTSTYNVEVSKDGSKVKSINNTRFALQYSYTAIGRDVPSFKVKISNFTEGYIKYFYRNEEGAEEVLTFFSTDIDESEIIELPKSYNTVENGTGIRGGFDSDNANIGVTIEQLPLYEGALVTDGKDDMIVSQKTVQEMLGGSNVCTVVSMIHTISSANNSYEAAYTNCIIDIDSPNNIIRNNVGAIGKTGIYGYKCSNLNTQTTNTSIINNILGDKNDYGISAMGAFSSTSKFSVIGFGNGAGLSEVAVYWTFISNKVLTTDEINQIIGYFKLDKYVTPQVIYDVKRQGLTNDTPAADWYLKDFSGNGYDMQLYNYLQAENSGIGKYVENFLDKTKWGIVSGVSATKDTLKVTDKFNPRVDWIVFADSGTLNDINLEVSGIPEGGTFILSINANAKRVDLHNGFNSLKLDAIAVTTTTGYRILYGQDLDWSKLIITQIPDYEGALVSDGKDDYGKAEGLPILKDYTVAADYARLSYGNIDSAIISKSYVAGNGAFGFNLASGQSPNNVSAISFGTGSAKIQADDNYRKIRYQSKYVNDGVTINAGNGIDGNEMWLSCLRENYNFSESALYSMLLFPYSLSEFLLERQLKKYKLGTLYPDMVEFRPILSGNIPYNKIEISQDSIVLYTGATDKTGIYLQEGSTVRVYIKPSGIDEVSKITINGIEYTDLPINVNGYYYADFPITKSPQKISYVIDEYIRFEDIVQPYPAIVNIPKVDGGYYTYGDKIPVGYRFRREPLINLLGELYTISRFYLNDIEVLPGKEATVSKIMVCRTNSTWKLNTSEPHAIYSPQKLNIPNSSLKILGYVPDLTGKGNHGKLNNFAYAGMSGANGYVEDFTKWRVSKSNIVSTISDNSIHFTHIGVNYTQTTGIFEANATSNKKYNIKVRISGLTSNMKCFFNNTNEHSLQELVNGVNEISVDLIAGWYGFNINTLDGSIIGDCDITIQQIGEHEGSICFDGTDDHITIPTLTHGGKCVMMKVNWSKGGMLYDQRLNSSAYTFGIYAGEALPAYNARNNGSTYIDGILNANLIPSDLAGITHNITVVNDAATDNNTVSPRLSVSTSNAVFSNMSLYEFMLFPEIPSEDEIKKLNDVMGIEGGYVESPNYYWDAYGKKNTDTDRNLIADQVSKDVANALEVKNVAYNSESGYTDDNGLLLDGVEDHAVNNVIPAVTDFTVIAKREFPESALVNNQTFLIKGDAINGNNNINSLLMECYYGAQNYIISFSHQQIVPLEESKISWITPTSYNGNALTKGSGVDSVGLTIGRYRDLYRKAVLYKAMFYTKTIDQLSINMLKNLFERDELIDVTNPIFKKQ